MNTLQDKSTNIWTAVQGQVAESMQQGNALANIKAFGPRRKIRVGQQSNPALYVLSRTTQVIEWGANRGVGELSITFGLTHTTFTPEDTGHELENLIYELVSIFMESPTLGGADYMRVEGVNLDDDPFSSEDTQPWVTAALVWVFQFIQP